MIRINTILVGVDFPDCPRCTLEQAARSARWNEASVSVIHVIDSSAVDNALLQESRTDCAELDLFPICLVDCRLCIFINIGTSHPRRPENSLRIDFLPQCMDATKPEWKNGSWSKPHWGGWKGNPFRVRDDRLPIRRECAASE